MVCAHGTTLGIQVPPAARTEMEAFKERSLYAQIHARQAEDYQACAYYLPLTSLLTSFLTSFLSYFYLLPTYSHPCLLPYDAHSLQTPFLAHSSGLRARVSRGWQCTNLPPGAYVPLTVARWLAHPRVRRRRHRAGELTTAYLLTA
jgi:hypothetical protein